MTTSRWPPAGRPGPRSGDSAASLPAEYRLTVCAPGQGPVDVVATVPASALLGALTLRLAELVTSAAPTSSELWSIRHDRLLSGDELVSDCNFRDGDVVIVLADDDRLPESGAGAMSAAELRVVAGPGSGLTAALRGAEIVIGRDRASSDLTVPDSSLSRRHVLITGDLREGFRVADAGSKNGTALNGEPLDADHPRPLAPGDLVRGGRSLFTVAGPRPTGLSRGVSLHGAVVQFNRPPRIARRFASEQLHVASPPGDQHRGRLPFAAALVPVVMGVVLWLVMHQVMMLLFAAMSPVMAVWTYVEDRRGGRRTHRAGTDAFREEVAAAVAQLGEARARERDFRRAQSPDLGTLCARADRLAPELWERRLHDPDALRLRIGTADLPSEIGASLASGGSAALRAEAQAAFERGRLLESIPVSVSLLEVGSLGLCGAHAAVLAGARALALQIAVLHSPEDVRICSAVDAAGRGRIVISEVAAACSAGQ